MSIFAADCEVCLSRIRDNGSCNCSKDWESRKKKIKKSKEVK